MPEGCTSFYDERASRVSRQVMLRALLGSEMTLDDCEDLIRRADVNGDGAIDFDEFVVMLQYESKLSTKASSLSS